MYFDHRVKDGNSSFELRQMAVQKYIKSPTTIISRLDRPTSGVLPIVLGHRLAKTTLWWHGWMIGLGIDGWLEGWIMAQWSMKLHLNLEPETSIEKWLFQSDDSKSLHGKWLFHQTSTKIWLFRVPGTCTWFLFLATNSVPLQKNRKAPKTDVTSLSSQGFYCLILGRWYFLNLGQLNDILMKENTLEDKMVYRSHPLWRRKPR